MSEPKSGRIEEVILHLQGRLSGDNRAETERFVRQFFERVAPEDVTANSADTLYALALSFLNFGINRKPGETAIRAYNPTLEEHGWTSARTVVEIINDDMPFLLDSLVAELHQRGIGIQLNIHPVLNVTRDTNGKRTSLCEPDSDDAIVESWIHIQIDTRPDETDREEIATAIKSVYSDVRSAVQDWQPMLGKLGEALSELSQAKDESTEEGFAEAHSFIEWINANHFTFLGYREYAYNKGAEDPFKFVEGTGLGVLSNPDVHVLRGARGTGTSSAARGFLESVKEPVMITKTSTRSVVHRTGHMDYLGIKRFNKKGELSGEHRFVGLFTSAAYNRSARDIPLLRRKVTRTVEAAGFSQTGHDGKALINILETFPRDELFQIGDDELLGMATGILHLQERPRIKLFFRRERFGRFVSCLVYVPREVHTTVLRKKIEGILEDAFGGVVSNSSTEIGESPLARIYVVIALQGDERRLPALEEIEDRLVHAARNWDDDMRDALIGHMGEDQGKTIYDQYRSAFSGAYCETFSNKESLADIEIIEAMTEDHPLALNMYRPLESDSSSVRFKIYHSGRALALSDCLPVIENMGLKVLEERPYKIGRGSNFPEVWLHDLLLVEPDGRDLDMAAIKSRFQTTFARTWDGNAEDDGFNRLVVCAGLTWREVVIIRAYAKYLRQIGVAFNQGYIEDTMAANPEITARLVELFHARFSLDSADSQSVRATELIVEIESALDLVSNLDQDRILRRFLNLIQSTHRTNFYQPPKDAGDLDPRTDGKGYVSFKINSGTVDELPLPRPHAEIFVYSPRVEAVHLRGGLVARGGIRWSDRREDFRTEVLGLMKAQMVKNAVIVPVGSKGGFVTKRLPTTSGREAVMKEVIACYTTMMSGMLDITDNYSGDDVLYPEHVTRHDGDDPYLVVAADKGTATFSDIANGIAESYGFWLGDAYASGGSAGYDHKKMGITARGAWESVKRHFREIGVDTQTEEFSVIGVGDMSGDVFGNGMLLSEHILLKAAFNHLHIFIDPTPDAAKSFVERRRLFDTPRTSWADYEAGLISKGGGIFERSAKSIDLSPEIQKFLNIDSAKMTPAELIRILLKTETDLLWFGGIGTYVRSSDETDADADDRANDSLRVTAEELNAKVVGEGANLGFTQRARIEFGLRGGSINTDAIDNSAGVDTSDREVNIKILLGVSEDEGEMTRKQRDRILAEMTDDVAALVLRDNYLQSQAITLAEIDAPARLEGDARFMRSLERAGLLDRELEFLPDDEAVAERLAAGQGFSRPEFSVLLAYSKMTLFDSLVESDVPEDAYLESDLIRYFPVLLREPYKKQILSHRLKREIIATHVANNLVNRGGITFLTDIAEETGATAADITRGYLVARESFGMRPLWKGIESLDNKIPADLQARMILDLMELHRHSTLWLVRNLSKPFEISTVLNDFGPAIQELWDRLPELHTETVLQATIERSDAYKAAGVPEELAERVARAPFMGAACHIVSAMHQVDRPITEVAVTYFALGAKLGLDWLRFESRTIPVKTHWEQQAITAIVEDLYGQQRALTARVFERSNGATGEKAIEEWVKSHASSVERTATLISEFKSAGGLDIARLAIANRYIRNMILK